MTVDELVAKLRVYQAEGKGMYTVSYYSENENCLYAMCIRPCPELGDCFEIDREFGHGLDDKG